AEQLETRPVLDGPCTLRGGAGAGRGDAGSADRGGALGRLEARSAARLVEPCRGAPIGAPRDGRALEGRPEERRRDVPDLQGEGPGPARGRRAPPPGTPAGP